MKFYTSVEQAGNRLLVRGYENGNRYSVRVPFNPTLYLPTKNYSEWRTLEGDCVEPHKFGSITEARDFVKQYKEVDDFEIYGNSRFLYQYIAEQHPEEELKFDSSKIRVFTIDIETAAENGFPDIETADQEILAISIKDSFTGRITVFGARPFNNQDAMVDTCEKPLCKDPNWIFCSQALSLSLFLLLPRPRPQRNCAIWEIAQRSATRRPLLT